MASFTARFTGAMWRNGTKPHDVTDYGGGGRIIDTSCIVQLPRRPTVKDWEVEGLD